MNFISEEFDSEKMIIKIGLNSYNVYPGDSPIACLWLPTTNVKISKDNSKNKMQPYNLIIKNLSNNQIIHAFKIK